MAREKPGRVIGSCLQPPGVPGPAQQATERPLTIDRALEQLHAAILPQIEAARTGDGTYSSLYFRKVIDDDALDLTVRPGKRK